jgi:uncharacterized protein YndB with AHSA1/START domain
MGHSFEQRREAEVPATPEQVWEAIASGPGITSWFMGRTEVTAGVVRTVFGEYAPQHAVSVSQRPRHFAYGSEPAGDGRFIAYEFLLEGRDGGTTVLRAVTSGFLPGDDWADEYEAMTLGTDLYFATLAEYLTPRPAPLAPFTGRFATPVTAFADTGLDWDAARRDILTRFGLTEPIAAGDRAQATIAGAGQVTGSVYFANSSTLGIRTQDTLLRFIRGFGKAHIAAHLVFADDIDADAVASAWRDWLGHS